MVARATGLSRPLIHRGLSEIAAGESPGLGRVRRMQVKLDDQIAVFVETPRHARRQRRRQLARGPAKEVSVGKFRRRQTAIETGITIRGIQLPRPSRAIDANIGVMDHATVAGMKFECPHVPAFANRSRNDEVAEGISPTGRQRIRVRKADDEVRFAEPPSRRDDWRRRQIRRVALNGAPIDPLLNETDLVRVEATRAEEFVAVPGFRLPRRHAASVCRPCDRHSPGSDVPVGEEAERGNLSGPMTGGAVFEHDRRDVLRERHARLRGRTWRGQDIRADDEPDGSDSSHGSGCRSC